MSPNLWLSTVALSDQSPPEGTRLMERLRAIWPEMPNEIESKQTGNVLTIDFAEATAGVTFIPRPMPLAEIEPMCEAAWYWPVATEAFRAHQSHLLFTLVDPRKDKVEGAMALTRLTAAAAESTAPAGVVWGPGRLVHPPRPFCELAETMSREHLPLFLWVDFRVESESDGRLRLFTTGLEALGLAEIEVPRYSGDAASLRAAAYNVAHYMIDRDRPVRDGETFGLPGGQSGTVRESKSMLDGETPVVELEFD